MLNKLAIPVTLITLLVIGLVRANPQDAELVNAYHERVAVLINSIPVDRDGWVGREVPLPQSATNLLRPNALVARQYVHEERGVSATLMVVQCRDARDMAGHYPPRCYPANGWLTPEGFADNEVEISGRAYRRYAFERLVGRAEREIMVYSVFVLPTGGTTTSMSDVYRLSSDFEHRHLGAAQIQFVIDQELQEEDLQWLLEEFAKLVEPTVRVVEFPENDSGRVEGDER